MRIPEHIARQVEERHRQAEEYELHKQEAERREQRRIEKKQQQAMRPRTELGFMVWPALVVAMFALVWWNFGLIEAVAALVAVVLLYKPISALVLGALIWWSERRA